MKTALTVLLFIAFATAVPADILVLKGEENTFTLYGFAKFDATYQDHAMNSWVAPRYPKYDTPENDVSSTNLTAMNSRFGFKWTGPVLASGTRVSGGFEFDIYDGTSRNQMKLRTRLAFLELKGAFYSLIAGQHWDLFGAGLPKTLLSNGFYWETGNTGFRRAQVRYTRLLGETQDLAVSVGDPTTDASILSDMPVVQTRYGVKWGSDQKSGLGLFAAYCREKVESQTLPIEGAGLDFSFAITPVFTIMGEVATGKNLKIFLTRAGYFKKEGGAWEAQKVTAGWVEGVYSGAVLDVYAGYAEERYPDPVPAGTLPDSSAIFGGLIHKLGKGVTYGVEFTQFSGDYQLWPSGKTKAVANQVDLAICYTF